MTELNELLAPPKMHSPGNDKCPFCPEQPPKPKYTTYPGEANNSTALGVIMIRPKSLVGRQKNARPKDGEDNQQSKPTPRKRDKRRFYSFQAHHLISGEQALKGESIERWIAKSPKDKIDRDTGYSVNNTDNGYWAPSVPNRYLGQWSEKKKVLSDDARQKAAEEVMEAAGAQIHIGPHNIKDPDDPKGYKHTSYDKYIKGKLKQLDRRIQAWAKKCPLCKPKNKKPQPSFHVHDVFDRLSAHLQGKITGPRQSWTIFLSDYALEYHKPVCKHTRRRKL